MTYYEEQTPEVGIGKLPEQREFKGYSLASEVLIPLAQAGLAGLAVAGKAGIKWLAPMVAAAFVLALALDFAGAPAPWVWLAASFPVIAWLAGGAVVALSKFFDLVQERMEREARSPWTDRPGEPEVVTRTVYRYRIIFVNGREAQVEDVDPEPEEESELEPIVDPHLRDLARFVALAADSMGLSRSSWCPEGGGRITLRPGIEVSQSKWAELVEELATKYRFVRKSGGAYAWAVDPKEAVAFLTALAGGQTEHLPPYPTASVGRLPGGR